MHLASDLRKENKSMGLGCFRSWVECPNTRYMVEKELSQLAGGSTGEANGIWKLSVMTKLVNKPPSLGGTTVAPLQGT